MPNTTCSLYIRSDETDNFERYTFAPVVKARCAVIDLDITVEKSSVRADTSGSRGQADQQQGSAMLLFPKTSTIKLGDKLFIDGFWLEVTKVYPRRAVVGGIDHIEVTFRKAEPVP
jgi:hypothetical protein